MVLVELPEKRGKCPDCGSQQVWKCGLRYSRDREIQRYLCRQCGYRFSESNININISTQSSELLHSSSSLTEQMVSSKKVTIKKGLDSSLLFASKNIRPQASKPHTTNKNKGLNSFYHYNSDCRVCALEKKAKNLASKTETLKDKLSGGATTKIKGKMLEFAWHLKKQGRSLNTIKTYNSLLMKLLFLNADLGDSESVKEVLTRDDIHHNTKALMVTAYNSFLKFLGGTWDKPIYNFKPKIPFIPLEKEIDELIAGCSRRTCTLLQLLKETGMRIGETLRLNWTDINCKSQTVSVNEPEKNSNPRILNISSKLISMLEALPKTSERIFKNVTTQTLSGLFKAQREKVARKLKNPRLSKITFHVLRHWKATMEYHKTKDIVHVQLLLGHKSINSTLKYISIEKALFKIYNDQWIIKVAKNIQEGQKLTEVGFEFHCDFGAEGKLFRKRK